MNSNQRDASLDIARGLAAIAVVFGHCWRGLASAGLMSEGPIFNAVDRAVYMVHLSVFAMLSGILVPTSFERKRHSYLRTRCATFIWLYVLWTVLQGSVQLITSSSVNRPISPLEILELWRPMAQFWFFPWIILMTVVVVVIKPWRNLTRRIIGLIIAVAVSYFTWGWRTAYAFTQGLGLTLFFFFGCVIGSERYSSIKHRVGMIGSLIAFIFGAIGYTLLLDLSPSMGPTMQPIESSVLARLCSIGCSIFGVVGVLAFSVFVERLPLIGKGLAFVGQQAMPVYLAQIIGSSGIRIILTKLSVTSVPLHAIAGTVVGTVGPLILWWLTRRHAPWLWTLPSPWSSRLSLEGKQSSI